MVLKNNWFAQLFRFGVIGVLAALVHFSVVVVLVELKAFQPLIANIFAFMIAFQVSYLGHRYWTFRGTTTEHRVAFPKLLFVNSLGFLANESLFFLFMNYLHLPYQLALVIVLTIIPMITFVINKFWVFQ